MNAFSRSDLDRVRGIVDPLAEQYVRAAPVLTQLLKEQWTAFLVRWGSFIADHQGPGPFEEVRQLEAFEGATVVFRNRLAEGLRAATPSTIPPGPPPGPQAPPSGTSLPGLPFILGTVAVMGFILWRAK